MNNKLLFLIVLCCIPMMLSCKKKKHNLLHIGDGAPEFSLVDENEKLRTLQEFKGKKVVLYFYPKDDTPGCTKEACSLRDAYADYAKHGIVILGISYDSPKSHAKFKAKHHLPFTLLSDSKKIVAHDYGADAHFLGHFIPQRKTFLINAQGKIVKIMDDVRVETHAVDILKAFGF